MRPKPMVDIGGHPVLWHILKMYSQHGIFDFVICLGYRGYMIKEYFANYFLHTSDVTFHMPENRMEVHGNADRAMARDTRRYGRTNRDGRSHQKGCGTYSE